MRIDMNGSMEESSERIEIDRQPFALKSITQQF